MFHYISGKVVAIDANLTVIDANGVGYALFSTANSQADLRIGENGKLFTYNVIREDCFDLYGFSTISEKRTFEMLIGVSGVGPKAALSILSANTPEQLAMAILSEDEKAITVAQGIGKKIAQRVILELKDKIAKNTPLFSAGSGGVRLPANAAEIGVSTVSDATAALTVLGYGAGEISFALRDVDLENLKLEEIIRQALKNLSK